MKILHILNYVGRGGSESYIKNLAQTNDKNISHELIYNIDGGGLDEFKKLGIKATQCDLNSPFDFKAAKFLKRYVKENDVDLVHTHFMRENGIVALAKMTGLKIPEINTRHMVNAISKKAAIFNQFFFRKNAHIIAVSSIVRDQLIKEGVKAEKIITLPPPFPVVENVEPVQKPEGEKWIISVGRLSKEKGPDFFVDGIAELFKDEALDNYKAIIIGYGDMEAELEEKIREYNLESRVQLFGYVPKPYEYLKASDLYVNHSYEEAFGLSIVEVAYCGVPIMMPDNVGAKDFFSEENHSALIYKMGDIKDFTEKAKRILKDGELQKSMTENAQTIVSRDITQEKIIQTIEQIYKGAIYGNKKN